MKKILPFVVFVIALFSANESKANHFALPLDTAKKEASFFSMSTLNTMVCAAQEFMGIPYRYGSTGVSSFDCSGFTGYVFKLFGHNLPRTARDQASLGEKVHTCDARKGDLIFFKGRNAASSYVGHVGIVVSEAGEALRFIHASVSKGITIDKLDMKYYADRFLFIKRIIE